MNSNNNKRESGIIRLRGGFSDTSGISPRNKTIQLYELDDDTRTKIINRLYIIFDYFFSNSYEIYYVYEKELSDAFCRDLLNDAFCEKNYTIQGILLDWRAMIDKINKAIEQATYNEVLDIIEYSLNWLYSRIKNTHALSISPFNTFNQLFEQEYVGYRFINRKIVAISDENEIRDIEKACNNQFDGCRAHINKAVGFLSDRKNKDYKNSIKESINAVESICKVIVGNEKATLNDALQELKKNGIAIHPSLKGAFIKLYGYSSDQGGVRHADGLFESNVTFEEAKFMLVSCCAFINYLVAMMGRTECYQK